MVWNYLNKLCILFACYRKSKMSHNKTNAYSLHPQWAGILRDLLQGISDSCSFWVWVSCRSLIKQVCPLLWALLSWLCGNHPLYNLHNPWRGKGKTLSLLISGVLSLWFDFSLFFYIFVSLSLISSGKVNASGSNCYLFVLFCFPRALHYQHPPQLLFLSRMYLFSLFK